MSGRGFAGTQPGSGSAGLDSGSMSRGTEGGGAAYYNANKRKLCVSDCLTETDTDRETPAGVHGGFRPRPSSPTIFQFTSNGTYNGEPEGKNGGYAESKYSSGYDHKDEPMEENIENRYRAAAEIAQSERHLRTIDEYFPSAEANSSGHSHLYSDQSAREAGGGGMDVTHTCTNCKQMCFTGELITCNFCQKEICNICDSTCRRCALAFCRNCSTTLYTQFSEDLVCLDCYQEVHCIS
jgi:hypothetical protein